MKLGVGSSRLLMLLFFAVLLFAAIFSFSSILTGRVVSDVAVPVDIAEEPEPFVDEEVVDNDQVQEAGASDEGVVVVDDVSFDVFSSDDLAALADVSASLKDGGRDGFFSRLFSGFFGGGQDDVGSSVGSGGPAIGNAAKPPVFVGRGCTTVFDIDWDCDGFGVGPNVLPDADDGDSSVTDSASYERKYGLPRWVPGSLPGIFKSRGYSVGDIWFVDPVNGTDPAFNITQIDARRNDITKPFKTTRPLVWSNWGKHQIVKPGDAIVFRAGKVDKLRLVDTAPTPDVPLKGTASKPILVTTYPGEEVIINGRSYSFSTPVGGDWVFYDGFVVKPDTGPGYPGILLGGANFNLLRNIETAGHKWGVRSNPVPAMQGVVLDKIVAHGASEHCVYLSAKDHKDFTVSNSLLYLCGRDGMMHLGNAKAYTVENNIIHSNSFGGISVVNGLVDSVFNNNLIFENKRSGIVLYTFWNSQDPYGAQSNNRNVFANNIVRGKFDLSAVFLRDNYPDKDFTRTIGGKSVKFPGKVFSFTDNRFVNNIFVTSGMPVVNAYQLRQFKSNRWDGNALFMDGRDEVLVANDMTDGTHDRYFRDVFGNNYWYWTLRTLQGGKIPPEDGKDNIITSPEFANIPKHGRLEDFDFSHRQGSFLIDRGWKGTGIPVNDLKGKTRIKDPDLGVYEA